MYTALQHLTEETLLAAYYKEGNSEYLGEILSRYTLRLLGVCMKYLKDEDLARDMVQQVFMKALGEIGKYKIDNFGGWLYRIAQNACISTLREKKNFTDEAVLNYIADENSITDEEHWSLEADYTYLQQALEQLKPQQKTCVELFYLQKQSYKAIADSTGLDIKEVKSNIQNGKRNLKLLIENFKTNKDVGK